MPTRSDIVRVARSYLGTPFHHLGRQPGLALDCAGLLICVARELGCVAPDFDVPAYTKSPDGSLLVWFHRYLRPVPRVAMQPGDAVALILDADPQHLGILCDYVHGGLSLIHAASRLRGDREVGCVIETGFKISRAQRLAAVGAFPGVGD